jgi:replicative DNA helicase
MSNLPFSEEAENHIIGACLVDGNETVAKCIAAKLTPASFHTPATRVIYSAILDIWAKSPPVALESVLSELGTKGTLSAVGGVSGLIDRVSGVSTTVHADYFIGKLRELHQRREIIRFAADASDRAADQSTGLEELISSLGSDFNRITTLAEANEDPFPKVAGQLAAEVEHFAQTGLVPHRDLVPWGIDSLDNQCRPLEEGELVVLGGRPSTGKSALADQVAWRTASTIGDVLLFTYEMTKREKAVRIAQQMTGLNYNQLGQLPRNDALRFAQACGQIRDCKRLHVFERDTSIARLTARVRTFHSRTPVRLVVVDFLQYLARLEPMVGKERTDEKVGRLTAALKDLARECRCPVLMLASLNRDGEKENRPPRMSDLRASGEIESDADVIALLHWPLDTPSGPQDPHDGDKRTFYVEFSQEKGRNKGVHKVGIAFDRQGTRFMPLKK